MGPDRETIEALKRMYPIGTRVRLLRMDDPYTKLVPGSIGTVRGVDDIGSILVSWDCGSSLNVLYGIDIVEKIE